MGSFAKSVITGFAFSLGAALFRKVAPRLGLDEKDKDKEKADGKRDEAVVPQPERREGVAEPPAGETPAGEIPAGEIIDAEFEPA